jgi:hypothetical protein
VIINLKLLIKIKIDSIMKDLKFLFVCILAVLTANLTHAQVSETTLDMDSINTTWTAVEKTDWNGAIATVNGLYGEIIDLDGIKEENIVKTVKVINISKSFEMVTDSVVTGTEDVVTGTTTTRVDVYETTTHPKYETQWLVYHNLNGDVIPVLTYDNPFSLGTTSAFIVELITTSGLHKGDDSVTSAKHPNDLKFAPKGENEIKTTDEY